ncbi:MAG: polyprenyl synthetase family protein [Solirubrobacteraceae bacterium]
MDFNDFYKEYYKNIENELFIEKTNFLKELTSYSKSIKHLYIHLANTIDGGKRIRGALVLLGYQLSGGSNIKTALKGAIAYEIFQSAILIHDDVIDQSETRRGKKTIHFSLGNNHYGNSQAICLGDIGFFWAVKLLNTANLEEKIKTKSVNEFLNVMIKTGIGEMLDIETPFFNSIQKSDIDAIHFFKTAEYSIIGPLKLGAIMANATNDILLAIEKIGKSLGLAYQLKDDVLGVFSNAESIGKSTLSDIQEKKITHLYLHALENANSEDQLTLKTIYTKNNITEKEVFLIKEIFNRSGSLKASNILIKEYIEVAKKDIEDSPIESNFKHILYTFSDFLQNRES